MLLPRCLFLGRLVKTKPESDGFKASRDLVVISQDLAVRRLSANWIEALTRRCRLTHFDPDKKAPIYRRWHFQTCVWKRLYLVEMSLKFVLENPFDNKPTLAQITAWHQRKAIIWAIDSWHSLRGIYVSLPRGVKNYFTERAMTTILSDVLPMLPYMTHLRS